MESSSRGNTAHTAITGKSIEMDKAVMMHIPLGKPMIMPAENTPEP